MMSKNACMTFTVNKTFIPHDALYEVSDILRGTAPTAPTADKYGILVMPILLLVLLRVPLHTSLVIRGGA
jgi:hypothetical protein